MVLLADKILALYIIICFFLTILWFKKVYLIEENVHFMDGVLFILSLCFSPILVPFISLGYTGKKVLIFLKGV